jgi:hypothetical protein
MVYQQYTLLSMCRSVGNYVWLNGNNVTCRHNGEFSLRGRKIMKTSSKTASEPTAIQLDTYQIQVNSANRLVTKHCSQAVLFLLCFWDVTDLYLRLETGYPD